MQRFFFLWCKYIINLDVNNTILILLKKAFLFHKYDYKFIAKINLFNLTVEISLALAKSILEEDRENQTLRDNTFVSLFFGCLAYYYY